MAVRFYATGTYSGGPADDTEDCTWTTGDTADLITVDDDVLQKGIVSVGGAGRIWGGTTYVTASFTANPSTSDTTRVVVVPTDSGSFGTFSQGGGSFTNQGNNFPHMPQAIDQWESLGLSPWGTWFGCQEPSGNAIGSGTTTFTVAATNTPTYEKVVTDWTRKFIGISGTVAQRFTAESGAGPNPGTTSYAMLAYCNVGPSIQGGNFLGLTLSVNATADANNGHTGQVTISNGALTKKVTGPFGGNYDDRVHPFLFVYDRTTSTWGFFSDVGPLMSSSVASQSDSVKGLGRTGAAASASICYLAFCTGSVAENLCNYVSASNFLYTMGWDVPWRTCPTDSGSIKLPHLPHHWSEVGYQPWSFTWNCSDNIQFHTSDNWEGVLWTGAALGRNPTTILHRQKFAGWNRPGMTLSEVGTEYMRTTNAIVSNESSVAYLCYTSFKTVVGASRKVFGQSTAGAILNVEYGVAGTPQLNCSGTITTMVTDHRDGRIHPVLIVHDKTNSRAKMYTDLEAHTGTFNAFALGVTANNRGIGATSGGTSGANDIVYFALTTGSQAEALSDDANASLFLKALGWNPPW